MNFNPKLLPGLSVSPGLDRSPLTLFRLRGTLTNRSDYLSYFGCRVRSILAIKNATMLAANRFGYDVIDLWTVARRSVELGSLADTCSLSSYRHNLCRSQSRVVRRYLLVFSHALLET